MAKDIINVAESQIGYHEEGKNRTKYGAWYGMNGAPWCHMFASWCANQAGVSTSIFPRTASTDVGMQWFKDHGLFKYKGSYTPKRGDVVYFKTGRSHVGLVESVTGNTLHTIEGNTSSKVARRTYSLSESTITGYGTPQYPNINSSAAGSTQGSSNKKKTSAKELAYLNSILKNHKSAIIADVTDREIKETNKLPDGKVLVLINNGKDKFFLPVNESMTITEERKCSPGTAKFEFKYERKYKVEEGNAVLIVVDGVKRFYGFVFTRSVSKDGMMSITAYNQLRYFKNKDTLVYKNKTASEVLKIIIDRFNLNAGTITDTKYKVSAIEDNMTLFDIMQNVLDDTMMTKGIIYTLWDDCGKLMLQDTSKMIVNGCLIDAETGEDYTYKTSIDSNTYNQVKLIYENKDKGTFDLYVTKDSNNINKWGVLQYLEKIDDPDVGKLKSQAYLKLYNQKTKNLTIKGVIGNTAVHAGCLIPVLLTLQDMKISNYMLVEKVVHNFKNKQYTMDLTVSGGGFSG
ncbi:CHAP domain-containing protein [[Clostridium] polysaccharolyticum]|uniref:CHAP domain-containing protein n=1 Tax=[Clostridium] polysaccharolyticum TaxID=29364 RepID=A0A1H9YIX9_9FIRM|nr:CHAP domain-containing protein [[Clostridium] polysaccharolyticum]SES68449.1 CHAP domain-containing protein [[Clostridium] polysaccharolyticum]